MILGQSITAEEFESEALPHLKGLYRTAAHVIGDRSEAPRPGAAGVPAGMESFRDSKNSTRHRNVSCQSRQKFLAN